MTIDDPKTFVKPFKVAFPITREPCCRNLEYARHEGGYAVFDPLHLGARAEEKKARAAKQ